MALAYPLATSASFPPAVAGARFDQPSPQPAVKRLDFPIRPHLLKFLHLHLARTQELPFQASDYALSSAGRFGQEGGLPHGGGLTGHGRSELVADAQSVKQVY